MEAHGTVFMHTWSILFNDFANGGCLYVVDDVVTTAGDEVAIFED